MILELADGTTYPGCSFGAKKSIAGELVFQTGMVGYPESLTDPSYKGQILVITFPLIGNYGVPSRQSMDELLPNIPAHFEANEIYVAGLVIASYSGESYSHHLAQSSLGAWLKEQGVPAMHGVDTRALTKRIRQAGSMLGKMMCSTINRDIDPVDEDFHSNPISGLRLDHDWQEKYEKIDWLDPNEKNLVAVGESALCYVKQPFDCYLTSFQCLVMNHICILPVKRLPCAILLADLLGCSA